MPVWSVNGCKTVVYRYECAMPVWSVSGCKTVVHVVCRYECAMPVWSCAWNTDDRNYFYAGLQNGLVLVFDVRHLSEPALTLNQDSSRSRSPVVSVQYMSGTSGNSIRL